MKCSLFIVFLFIGISQGFFGSIGQAINNVGNTVNQVTNEVGNTANQLANQTGNIANQVTGEVGQAVDNVKTHVENVVGQILNIANGIQFAARFLWDSVFSPAFDMMIQGGQIHLDDKFGAIGNVVGQPIALPENPLSDKYAQLVARFKTNIHNLYEQLFLIEQEAMKAIEKGEMNFEERIRAFYDKIDAIQKQINEWAAELKLELEASALPIAGDWENIINQYKQNIDSTVQSIERMFQQLTQNLMKNFLDFVSNIVPNANNMIENLKRQGLLSFIRNKIQ